MHMFVDRYTYNSASGTLGFTMPTRMHGSGQAWVIDWMGELKETKEVEKASVAFFPELTLKIFERWECLRISTPTELEIGCLVKRMKASKFPDKSSQA